MKIDAFYATQGLEITEDISPIQLMTSVSVDLLHESKISTFDSFFNEDRIILIGHGLMYAMAKNPFFYYSDEIEEQNFGPLVQFLSSSVGGFISYLWFIKDNSCYCTFLHVFGVESDDESPNMAYRYRNGFYSTADGTYRKTTFSKEEILEAVNFEKIHSSFTISIAIPKDTSLTGVSSGRPNNINYNNISRVSRAFMFIQAARSTSFLPEKISYYIIVLECLFSANDKSEIQHKIAERVARYIGETIEQRRELFKFIKSAYTIRSKYLHGQKLDKRDCVVDRQKDHSVRIDSLIRKIMRKIFLEDLDVFLLEEEQLGEWFNDLLLS